MKRYVGIFFFFCFFNVSIQKAELFPGTLIKTPEGQVPIEQLKRGQYVLDHHLQKVCIKRVLTKKTHCLTLIRTEKGVIALSPEQKVWDPILAKWIIAAALTKQNVLLNAELKKCACLDVRTVGFAKQVRVYDLALEKPHTFFFSAQQILTHNVVPTIVLGVALTFDTVLKGIQVATYAGIAIGAIAGIVWLAKSEGWRDPNWQMPSFNPQFPEDPENNKFQQFVHFTTSLIEKAVNYAVKDNNLEHFFKPKHNFGPLLEKFGSQQNVVYEVLKAIDGKLLLEEGMVFGTPGKEVIVEVGGYLVHIHGKIINGIPLISTMFIK